MKKLTAVLMAGILSAGILSGCAQVTDTVAEATSEQAAQFTTEDAAEAVSAVVEAVAEAAAAGDTAAAEVADAAVDAAKDVANTVLSESDFADVDTEVRVGSLKGPTTMGLVNMMQDSEDGKTIGNYTFKMATDPSEIVSDIAAGNLDIALVPANLAATLYNKTEGGVSVIDMNTMGVLYCVTGDDSIHSVADLAGKTLLTTGQGATPEYSIKFLLDQYDVKDCTLEFHSEASEIAALLKEDSSKIAVLPQPFATAAQMQNEDLKEAFSLDDEWVKATDDSAMVTGATIVRNDFLKENEKAVVLFEIEHVASAAAINADPTKGGELCAKYGIVEKAPLATKAISKCNIVAIPNDTMKTNLSGYLKVLFDADPKSVGGKLPGDDFYYMVQDFKLDK